ncbi:(2Fe-2S)-binding protein [Paraburkholderia domus]|uniref:(2Fe-2S)-binding protein n=1 Tax=Paraburkholderia domus TaxID=2793075 RepID=UPI0019113810|nr:(2Fe-2S)-binding protein [Paraburkholderia domus]MBK5065898.1 (2Fe-2S)-binding protein [Burkholderia sp. R-70199]CAE6959211.1 hypothetical protein R70199_07184 [Paraburkholderia domus]
MFRTLQPSSESVEIFVDGKSVPAADGSNLASALLLAGFAPFRLTPVSSAPRIPYCMMGVCFDCLACVDDVPNVQTCLVKVRAGMKIDIQRGAAEPPIGEGQ